jgi:hypothetical protein
MVTLRRNLLAFVLSITIVTVCKTWGSAPTLDVIYPPGVSHTRDGSTNVVTVSGKFDPWPPKVWVSAPGVEFTAQTNKGKFDVTVAANAEPGPRLIRLYNDEGASEARFFVVGAGREIADAESNNHFAKPQPVGELPVTINGRLDKSGDVDSFAVSLRAGQCLDARVDSHTIMSKADPVLRLTTTNGSQLSWNHDFATLDPRITWCATNDGTVIVQIYGFPYPATSDVKLYGGDSAIYRLHVAALSESRPPPVLPTKGALQPPATVHATVTGPEQHHPFTATKDELLSLKVAAAASGSQLDAVLKIEDADGRELARNDDAEGTRDPSLEWKAPTNGTFNAVVASLTHRGGPDHHYCLTLDRALPDFRATLSASSLVVKPDSTNSLKFNVKRLRGHTNDLVASFKDLPEGVTALATNVPANGGEMILQLVVATNAPVFQGPIRIIVSDTIAKEERLVSLPLTGRSEDNGVPGGYTRLLIDQLDHLWLTVRPAPAEKPKETAAKSSDAK